ncbi:hypothetical protein AJ80_07672 [Polytolypa hystricis UAMH7299]|uniref:Uncharacterized protein n=1 Tax=Polytolypa hystricis (strain UAMH7299) TaxID=1447883 RepID=A0A2B7XLH0_POLH7|nr:hypothetical protein AJ80_07672 [Polytolypa hystricis UAMH7299]
MKCCLSQPQRRILLLRLELPVLPQFSDPEIAGLGQLAHSVPDVTAFVTGPLTNASTINTCYYDPGLLIDDDNTIRRQSPVQDQLGILVLDDNPPGMTFIGRAPSIYGIWNKVILQANIRLPIRLPILCGDSSDEGSLV